MRFLTWLCAQSIILLAIVELWLASRWRHRSACIYVLIVLSGAVFLAALAAGWYGAWKGMW